MNAEQMWKAVAEKDASAAGRFFFAVKTTGVFCKPGCASRLPLKKNVQFFNDARTAEVAGFRPCKRCEPVGVPLKMRVMNEACRLLANSALTIREVARTVGVSQFYFQRQFKKQLGVTPLQYRRGQRGES